MTTIPATENRTARAVTDGLEPKNVILAVCLVLGAAQNDMLVGLAWAVHAIVFAAVIPMAYIKYGIRSGRWQDRHVGQRERRLHLIPVIMASVGIAIAAMVIWDAPAQMTALVVAMLATLGAILPVTAFWKISVHTSVAAGAIAILAVGVSPVWALAFPLVALIGWSRVALRDHTFGQVVAGTVLGALVAGAVFAGLA
ncbi:phosphatase PAP2 family protein [Streptomyces sp. NPDC020490]|uniref:phosphatase PAP2 family protein n=1 Tax=Streptomyces sp. NPDC020490 TaxID=3365078 RepID=UPI0037A41BDA